MDTSHPPEEATIPVRFEAPQDEPTPVVGVEVAGSTPGELDGPTLFLDWDRERYAGTVPRRIPLPIDDAGPAWLAFPHQRYVLCARHSLGHIDYVYVTSLMGRRDSLIPAGAVERIVSDDRSVTVVVDGRPFIYNVEAGTTMDLTARRVMGTTQA